jgi:hypothetical protein
MLTPTTPPEPVTAIERCGHYRGPCGPGTATLLLPRTGQATSYFYGYQRLLDLRARTEIALGKAFNRRRFHDFVLGQGLLAPDQMARAVEQELVPAERTRLKTGAARQ